MVREHTFDYQPSPSGLTSRIHPLIFAWTPWGFISPEYLLTFCWKLYIPPWLWKSFKFMMLSLLGNAFASQTIESFHFHSCSHAKLSPRFLSSPPGQVEIMKKRPKLNLRGYWSQILINPIIFAPFIFLVSICCAII